MDSSPFCRVVTSEECTDVEHKNCNCFRSPAAILYSQDLLELKHQSSLCEFARRGDVQGVRGFLKKGRLEVDSCNVCGYNPLLYACKNGNLEVCQILIEDFGASLRARTRSLRANCLHRAAVGGSVEVTRLLLRKDPGLAAEADVDGNLPIHKASSGEVYSLLLEAYPQGGKTKNRRGELPSWCP